MIFISWNVRNSESDHIGMGASVILHCSANTRYTRNLRCLTSSGDNKFYYNIILLAV